MAKPVPLRAPSAHDLIPRAGGPLPMSGHHDSLRKKDSGGSRWMR
jgi:hypothetical protein